jgi:RNA polymerase sigma-70 factor, ECF subfamily
MDAPLSAGAEHAPDAIFESKLTQDKVRKAIASLPEGMRRVLVLREYEGLSYQEIARILSCPAGTVMSRLGRARARIKATLKSKPRSSDAKSASPYAMAA